MFYQDEVVLGEAKLLAYGVKNGVCHPKTDELERGCVMEQGLCDCQRGAKALAVACEVAYRILLTCSRM